MSARYACCPVDLTKPPKGRLLRIAVLYHALLGGVAVLLPGDLLSFVGLEPPTHWFLYFLVMSAPLLAGVLLELAHRRKHLQEGILWAVIAGNLSSALILGFFVLWSELPVILLGPTAAAGLWAWLLWGMVPEEEA